MKYIKQPLIPYIDELRKISDVLDRVQGVYELLGYKVIVTDIVPPNTIVFLSKDSYLEVKDVKKCLNDL